MHTSNIEVSHTLPLSCSSGGWCHPVSDGNASALKTQGEALVLRSALFRSTRRGENNSDFWALYYLKMSLFSDLLFQVQLISPLKFALFTLFRIVVMGFSPLLHFLLPRNREPQSPVAHLWRVTVVFCRVTRTSPSSISVTTNISRVGPETKMECFLKTTSPGLLKIHFLWDDVMIRLCMLARMGLFSLWHLTSPIQLFSNVF